MITRRSFLIGSTWVLASATVLAHQSPTPPPHKPVPEPDDPQKPKVLIDDEGREYRVCPQCGNNMYKQGRMWVCENCGYSYVE